MFHKSLVALSFRAAGACYAQANVGEVTAAGGVRLTKDDMQALYAGGVTVKSTLGNGAPYSQINKADGTVGGTAGDRGQFTLAGTWKIDDAGRFCHDIAASGGLKFNNCTIIWKVGEKYFAALNDSPTTAVRERQFVK